MDLSKGLLVLAILALPALAGCLGGTGDDTDDSTLPGGITSVFERKDLPFNTTDFFSQTLTPGPYDILAPGTHFMVNVDLPATAGITALAGLSDVSIGVHFPDIPGCDWGASDLPEHCNIPVIADIGPYYAATKGFEELQLEPEPPVTEHSRVRLFGFLVENFVPHGYAVAAVSVYGTGDSQHCMDLMGPAEQAGVQAAVDFLGSQAWSNGNVGLIGRSYDGSTPWQAAMAGSPHLKTIVPISGLMGVHDLMWRNGSAELRATSALWAIYAAYTIDGDPMNPLQFTCPEFLMGPGQGTGAYLTGDRFLEPANPYWAQRDFFERVHANYEGSVYLIQGLQDWNVDPHQAFPYYNQLLDKGLEMKGLFGQWGHHYPDRPSEHSGLPGGKGGEAFPQSVRYDWAQDLLEWFDHYLMGTGPKPALHVEVQDNQGGWRIESEYPPRDATRIAYGLDEATKLHSGEDILYGASPLGIPAGPATSDLRYVFPPLSEDQDTRIAGEVHFHVTVTPTGPGGQIGAILRDAETGLRLGHAIMDLRYAAGGKEMQPVVPGMPIVAHMEFFTKDLLLPAGHGLLLEVLPTVEDYLPSTTTNPIVIDTTSASALSVPVVERGPEVFFTPPAWQTEE